MNVYEVKGEKWRSAHIVVAPDVQTAEVLWRKGTISKGEPVERICLLHKDVIDKDVIVGQ